MGSLASDFKLYEEQYFGGMFDRIQQVIQAFNGNSANTIRLSSRVLPAHFNRESIFKKVADMISRRDITSIDPVADKKLEQDEFVGVKVNRTAGPVASTLDAWKKIAKDPQEFSFLLGQMYGEAKIQDMINTAILVVESAISGQSDLNFDATGESTKTTTHAHIVSGISKMGDQAGRIRAFVMHSKPYYDLVKQAIGDKIFEVAGAVIYSGTVATFGKPTIVIDSPALHDANGSHTDTYNILGLTEGAIDVVESEQETVAFDLVTGLKNLMYRYQAEYAYNLNVKGMRWDTQNGGINPSDATLGTSSNWIKVLSDIKSLSGVRIKVQ